MKRKERKELQARMEAKRIINEAKYNLLSSRFNRPWRWSSSFIINHSNIEMRNLFCFYDSLLALFFLYSEHKNCSFFFASLFDEIPSPCPMPFAIARFTVAER